MDFKLMLTTFGLIFLAELGDKTQLATFCLSADTGSRISVFLGAAGALVLSSWIAVVFGGAINKLIPTYFIKIGAGAFFVGVGLWMLVPAVRAFTSP
ncbi:MAG: TMEM165/GDT1 family protein [Deltaproteobacteria bacterium]|nr:TMEM165/GDT1 family protein [Deltaproteobacteria bacterium]MBW2538942.1 TMEM165/GDT1 family protein [Deltaproteobacteria bacterium]